jgi:hypothetical protein
MLKKAVLVVLLAVAVIIGFKSIMLLFRLLALVALLYGVYKIYKRFKVN